MRGRFVMPTPNCGHGGTSYTHVSLADLWMCPACIASIGPLYRTCSNCGHFPPAGTQLVDVHRAGHLCFTCRRDYLATRRFAS